MMQLGKVIIRDFNEHDLKRCVKIIQDTLGKSTAKQARAELLEGLNPKNNTYSFLKRRVAESNGEVIAISGAYRFNSHNPALIGIGWFAVDKKFQNMGLGTRLLKWVMKEAKKNDKSALFVWTNKSAKLFYTHFGFKESEMKILPQEDEILLVKKI